MYAWLGPSSTKITAISLSQNWRFEADSASHLFQPWISEVKTMDIIYMRTKNGYTNDSDFIHSNFIAQNPEISIPYLIMMAVITLSGCIGNALVIGSVATYKVHSFNIS